MKRDRGTSALQSTRRFVVNISRRKTLGTGQYLCLGGWPNLGAGHHIFEVVKGCVM